MKRYKSLDHGVSLELLHKKRKVGVKLHLFLGVGFLGLRVFGNAELRKRERNAPKYPTNKKRKRKRKTKIKKFISIF
jgi:hypothetical protein